MEHALFLCNYARAVWFGCNLEFLAHSIRSMDIVEWWGNILNLNDMAWKQENPNLPSMVLIIWWALWKSRNNFIFKGIAIDPKKIIGFIQNMYPCNREGDYEKDCSSSPKVLKLPRDHSNNTLLIFSDAAFNIKDGKSSFDYLMMIYNLFVRAGAHYGPKLSSSKEAKARAAILFALKEASCKGFSEIALFQMLRK